MTLAHSGHTLGTAPRVERRGPCRSGLRVNSSNPKFENDLNRSRACKSRLQNLFHRPVTLSRDASDAMSIKSTTMTHPANGTQAGGERTTGKSRSSVSRLDVRLENRVLEIGAPP